MQLTNIFLPTDTRATRLYDAFTLKKTTNYVKIVLGNTKEGVSEMKRLVVVTMIIWNVVSAVTLAADRLSLGYIYGAPISHSQTIQRTQDSINVVSPTGFDLTVAGRLDLTVLLDRNFIQEMHEQNKKVTPFLSNHWGRERAKNALDNPEALISDIVAVVKEYDLDGINVDLENLPSEYKDKLTNFVRMLKEALGSDKTVSIAVAANPYRLTSTWLATYDYEALGKYADYLVLMAYDEHGIGGGEGPVASINYVKASLEYILELVSKDKVVLGIPLYGRYWKEESDRGGDAFTTSLLEDTIKKYKLYPELDEETMSAKLVWDIPEGEEIEFNGVKLERGTYTFWYENEESIKAKLKLVNEHNILGAALWALTQEDKSFWNYYKSALNETPYESDKTMSFHRRQEIYKKITILRKEPVKHIPTQLSFSYQFEDNRSECLEKLFAMLEKNDYQIKDHISEDEKKYYFILKRQRVTIKNYNLKSHLTVTLF